MGAKFAYGGNDARGCVEDCEAIDEGDDDGGCDGFDGGVHEAESGTEGAREGGDGVEDCGVARH